MSTAFLGYMIRCIQTGNIQTTLSCDFFHYFVAHHSAKVISYRKYWNDFWNNSNWNLFKESLWVDECLRCVIYFQYALVMKYRGSFRIKYGLFPLKLSRIPVHNTYNTKENQVLKRIVHHISGICIQIALFLLTNRKNASPANYVHCQIGDLREEITYF